jgi:hypothetical protein
LAVLKGTYARLVIYTRIRTSSIRAFGLPDLLIAAVAERERVTVLHYDGEPSGFCTKYSVYPPGFPRRCFGRNTPYV